MTPNQKKRRGEERGRASLLRSSDFTTETRQICLVPPCPSTLPIGGYDLRALAVVATLGIVTNSSEPRKATQSSVR